MSMAVKSIAEGELIKSPIEEGRCNQTTEAEEGGWLLRSWSRSETLEMKSAGTGTEGNPSKELKKSDKTPRPFEENLIAKNKSFLHP